MKKTLVVRAPDGSARVIANVGRFYGEQEKPTVFAFAFDR